jgi:hypothetical protein
VIRGSRTPIIINLKFIVPKDVMSKKYYRNAYEVEVAIVKLLGMDEEKATMLYGMVENEQPAQRLVKRNQRKKTYAELDLPTLEYLWVGCEKCDLQTRLSAKASYLVRCT